MTDNLKFEVSDRIATLTLDRPEKLNAFTNEMLHGLVAALDECESRDDVLVVILTGAGRGFCSGGDVGNMGEAADNRPHVTKDRIWRDIQAFPKRLARFEKTNYRRRQRGCDRRWYGSGAGLRYSGCV